MMTRTHTILLFCAFAWQCDGFTPVNNLGRVSSWSKRSLNSKPRGWQRQRLAAANKSNDESPTSVFDEYLEQGKLDKASQYLAEHEDFRVDKDRWNAIFDAIGETTAQADATENLRMQQQQQLYEFPLQSKARQDMTTMYTTLRQRNDLTLFGAVDAKRPLVAGKHVVSPQLLEEILGLPMSALTPKPTNTLILAGVAVAVLQGLLSMAFNIPLSVLILGTLLAVTVDRLFLNSAVLTSLFTIISPGVNAKIIRHEAGHLLAAYLLGCPVEGIVLSAWAALQDERFGSRQVSAGTSFFDQDLSYQINTKKAVTRSAVDRYSIIVMAGIAAEAEFYQQADGGASDEMALVAFLRNVGWTDAESIKNQARWGAMQAVLLVREYKPAYEALVDALERGGTLGDAISAIEDAARQHNLKPLQQPIGYIVDGPDGTTVYSTEESTEPSSTPTTPVLEEQPVQAKPFDEQESMETLQTYKSKVQERLKELDQKLSEL